MKENLEVPVAEGRTKEEQTKFEVRVRSALPQLMKYLQEKGATGIDFRVRAYRGHSTGSWKAGDETLYPNYSSSNETKRFDIADVDSAIKTICEMNFKPEDEDSITAYAYYKTLSDGTKAWDSDTGKEAEEFRLSGKPIEIFKGLPPEYSFKAPNR